MRMVMITTTEMVWMVHGVTHVKTLADRPAYCNCWLNVGSYCCYSFCTHQHLLSTDQVQNTARHRSLIEQSLFSRCVGVSQLKVVSPSFLLWKPLSWWSYLKQALGGSISGDTPLAKSVSWILLCPQAAPVSNSHHLSLCPHWPTILSQEKKLEAG